MLPSALSVTSRQLQRGSSSILRRLPARGQQNLRSERPLARPMSRSQCSQPGAAMAEDGAQKLQERDRSFSEYESMWFWKMPGGLQPGQFFDASGASPALIDLLGSGTLPLQGQRVFVPGCGRGYDLVEFAKQGAAEVVGLELAPTAASTAGEYVAEQLKGGGQEGSAKVIEGNFLTWRDPKGPFDIMYDYTFFCALSPDMREGWAKSTADHVRLGGTLVTLMFPVDKEKVGGPPHGVWPELYESLLTPVGFELVSLTPVPVDKSHPNRGGKEIMGMWRRKA